MCECCSTLGSVTWANIPAATANHTARARFCSREVSSALGRHEARASHHGQALHLLDRGKYSVLGGGGRGEAGAVRKECIRWNNNRIHQCGGMGRGGVRLLIPSTDGLCFADIALLSIFFLRGNSNVLALSTGQAHSLWSSVSSDHLPVRRAELVMEWLPLAFSGHAVSLGPWDHSAGHCTFGG